MEICERKSIPSNIPENEKQKKYTKEYWVVINYIICN